MPADEPWTGLPLHVLTGFLGSGKTTLLNRLLREPALADSAVLINEIGAVAIDHHLVERMERGDALDIMVLQGGCTCCAVRGDLVAALRELHARRAQGRCRRSAASCWRPPGSPIRRRCCSRSSAIRCCATSSRPAR